MATVPTLGVRPRALSLRAVPIVIGALAPPTARERVASFPRTLAATGRPCGRAQTRLHLPMTRSDIAHYPGLTIETVSRALTRLRSDRLIALHGAAEVEILDLAGMRALGGAED